MKNYNSEISFHVSDSKKYLKIKPTSNYDGNLNY